MLRWRAEVYNTQISVFEYNQPKIQPIYKLQTDLQYIKIHEGHTHHQYRG